MRHKDGFVFPELLFVVAEKGILVTSFVVPSLDCIFEINVCPLRNRLLGLSVNQGIL
jgi:hypothetical protein